MSLPDELGAEASLLLRKRYEEFLRESETVEVCWRTFPEEAVVTVRIESQDSEEQSEIAAKVPFPADRDEEKAVYFALDAVDAFMGEWLERGREERHSIDFVEHVFQDRPVFVRLHRRRPSLEAAADRLLRDDTKKQDLEET